MDTTTATIYFSEKATNVRPTIACESQKQNGCTGQSILYKGTLVPTHQHMIHPVCTNKASVNEPYRYGYYTLRKHMDTHVRAHIDT